MFKHFLPTTTFGLALVLGSAAFAGQNCAPRAAIVDKLTTKYAEQPAASGLQSSTVMEVFASPDTGSFTVLITHSNGVSCIVAAGTDWFVEDPVAEPEGVAG